MRRVKLKSKEKRITPKEIDKRKLLKDFLILIILITCVFLLGWKIVDYRFVTNLVGGFIIFAFVLWKILSLYLNANEYSERKDFVDLHAKILGSAALVISLLFTWQGIKNNQKTSEENQRLTLQSLENAERQQLEERYNNALEKLGSEKKEPRLGAIYSLGKIANDSIELSKKNPKSKDFYWEIMQTLASYIRGNAPISSVNSRPTKEMPTDIQAAMNVLAWRSRSFKNGADEEDQRLELYETDLRGLILKDKEVSQNNPQPKGANFEGARIYGANFEKSDLRGINFKGAILTNVSFKDANLATADLTGADLSEADLDGVDLGQAKTDADQIMSAINWEKAKTLPQDICREIKQRGNIEIPKGCK